VNGGGHGGPQARRVLVVDDEQDIRDLVTTWLIDDPRRAAVTEAADLDGAVQAAHAASCDAVRLDFRVGARVCVEVLPEIRQALPDAIIVVYSANRGAATDAGVTAAGADIVLEKATIAIDDVIDVLLTATRDESQTGKRRGHSLDQAHHPVARRPAARRLPLVLSPGRPVREHGCTVTAGP